MLDRSKTALCHQVVIAEVTVLSAAELAPNGPLWTRDSLRPDCALAAQGALTPPQATFGGVSRCLQAFGANGLEDKVGLARQIALARVDAFMDGTSEIRRLASVSFRFSARAWAMQMGARGA